MIKQNEKNRGKKKKKPNKNQMSGFAWEAIYSLVCLQEKNKVILQFDKYILSNITPSSITNMDFWILTAAFNSALTNLCK